MKFTIDSEQKKFFLKERHIEFESLLHEAERCALLKMIAENSPPITFFEQTLLSRSAPSIKKIIRRKQLAEIVYELTGDRPLRLACAQGFYKLPSPLPSSLSFFMEGPQTLWGLLLPLEGKHAGNAHYFHADQFPLVEDHQWHVLFIFTKHFLNEKSHPIVYR
jgi:hypothetical protein